MHAGWKKTDFYQCLGVSMDCAPGKHLLATFAVTRKHRKNWPPNATRAIGIRVIATTHSAEILPQALICPIKPVRSLDLIQMREYPFTEDRHKRWLAEGRGSGDGATWNPWLHRGDFSSVGKAAIDSVEGADGREIHVFSALERLVWMLYSSKWRVLKIHEQVPLPRERTREIARSIGVVHPRDPDSRVDIVMTSDFVIWALDAEMKQVKLVRSVKASNDLANHNQMEHAEIERRYWLEDGSDFKFITENSIGATLARNLDVLYMHRGHHNDAEPLGYEGSFKQVSAEVIDAILRSSGPTPLFRFLTDLNSRKGWPPGLATGVALNRIRWHELRADYTKAPLGEQAVAAIAEATRSYVKPVLP